MKINEDFLPYEVYSTNEVRVGTWIDGKPVYRKIIVDTTYQNNYRFNHNIPNIDMVINVSGRFYSEAYGFTLPTCFYSIQDGVTYYAGVAAAGKTQLEFYSSYDTSSRIVKYFVLDYTKTTD